MGGLGCRQKRLDREREREREKPAETLKDKREGRLFSF